MDVLRRSMIAWCIAAGLPGLAGRSALAAPQLQGSDLVRALREGGYTLYMRHARTETSQQDLQGTDYANCSKQRNLSATGRAQARAAAEAIGALRLPIGEVLSSPYCRAVETARLMFGRGEISMDVLVRSGPDGQPDFAPLLRLVGTAPAPGTLRVIVAHNAPRIASLEEGETAIVRPLESGFQVVAQLDMGAWARLARP